MKIKLKRRALISLSAAALSITGLRSTASAGIITQWSFPAAVPAPPATNSPAPTTGTGTAISLGMTNNYTYANGEGPGSVTNDDITQPGSKTQLADFTWRIRGNGNSANSGPGVANGWNLSAPNYTQGAEFEVPTTGYTGIGVSFDWYCTTQGIANLQFQYTLDDTQATPTWVNLTPTSGTQNNAGQSNLIASSSNFFGTPAKGSTTPTCIFDLSSIPGAANDANFAFQMVSVIATPLDANYTGTGNYQSAAGGDYNNSSGNWSFGNITVTGAAVPEPTSLGILALGALGLTKRRRTSK